MKKLISILSFIFLLTPIFSQVIDDAQLFGSSRGTAFGTHEFGVVAESVVNHEFTLKNSDLIDITVVSVSIPQGVSVMIPQKVIQPNQEGKILVSVYKDYIESLDESNRFKETFSITVQEILITGIVINKTYTYQVSGKFE